MVGRLFNQFALVQALVMAAVFMAGCELPKTPEPSATCGAKTAVIQVFDNGLKRGCGCTETAGTLYGPGSSFTCTINAGTNVLFFYPRIQTVHSIYIQSTITFAPRYPDSSNVNQVDGQLMNRSGNFTFGDTATNVTGTFTVL